jgi:hypothetical protein
LGIDKVLGYSKIVIVIVVKDWTGCKYGAMDLVLSVPSLEPRLQIFPLNPVHVWPNVMNKE